MTLAREAQAIDAVAANRPAGMPRRALLSIHDVTPATLGRAQEFLELLGEPATLLIVTGAGWTHGGVDELKRLEESGHELAAHGWTHRCESIRSWRHRLHSMVLSRGFAEHLSLDEKKVREILVQSYEWFEEAGLQAPSLYVPPAWAMGPLPRDELHRLPYGQVEFLTGIHDCRCRRFRRLPLVGYEADTRWRRNVLRAVNGANRIAARVSGRPLRIAVHPFDLDYFLAADLRAMIRRPAKFISYGELAAGDEPAVSE